MTFRLEKNKQPTAGPREREQILVWEVLRALPSPTLLSKTPIDQALTGG